MRTPWGEDPAPRPLGLAGVLRVSTPSHGGYYVPPALLSRIPKNEQAYARSWSGSATWYEEDCCALSVALAFPELFPDVTDAHRSEYRLILARYMTPDAEVESCRPS